jgi:N-acetylglutamate synthase-like GNAT family acetyltransferase
VRHCSGFSIDYQNLLYIGMPQALQRDTFAGHARNSGYDCFDVHEFCPVPLPVIRQATSNDLDSIIELLRTGDLRTEGIMDNHTLYWVAKNGPDLIGAIGLELGGTCALLRSAVVSIAERGRGIGGQLTEGALEWAWRNGYRVVYCFSTDAGAYWRGRGFKPCAVDEVVRALPKAPQVLLFEALGLLPAEAAFCITADSQTDSA